MDMSGYGQQINNICWDTYWDLTEISSLIYFIRFLKANKIHDSIAMSLYTRLPDGGSLWNEDIAQCISNGILNAGGIILLIDPLEFPAIRKKLDGKVKLPDRTSDTSTADLLSYVVDLMKYQKKIKGEIDIPIALVLTKMDVLAKYDVLPDDSCLRVQSEHIAKGGFVKSDFEETNFEIRFLLEDGGIDEELLMLLRQFTRYSFFGVPSLEENPAHRVKLREEPNSIRVLDPLLWLLSIHKYIKTI